jgi:hypothetical protein
VSIETRPAKKSVDKVSPGIGAHVSRTKYVMHRTL